MLGTRQAFAAALAAACAGSASAQDIYGSPGADLYQQGGWYIGSGHRYQTLHLPRIENALRVAPGASALLTLKPDFDLHGANSALGYALPDVLPPWLGRNVRIEGFGWWVTANRLADQGSFGTLTTASLVRVDGINSGISPTELNTRASIRAVSQLWQVGLRVATDYDLHPNIIWSPEIAAIGGRQYDDYKLFDTGAITTAFTDNRIYNLNTTRIGGYFGSRLTFKTTPWLAFYVSGFVGALHTNASLDASESLNNGLGTTTAVSVSTSRSALAIITGGQIGAQFSTGGAWIFGIAAGLDYNNRVAGARTPTTSDPGPISIKFGSALNYSVMTTVKVRLF